MKKGIDVKMPAGFPPLEALLKGLSVGMSGTECDCLSCRLKKIAERVVDQVHRKILGLFEEDFGLNISAGTFFESNTLRRFELLDSVGTASKAISKEGLRTIQVEHEGRAFLAVVDGFSLPTAVHRTALAMERELIRRQGEMEDPRFWRNRMVLCCLPGEGDGPILEMVANLTRSLMTQVVETPYLSPAEVGDLRKFSYYKLSIPERFQFLFKRKPLEGVPKWERALDDFNAAMEKLEQFHSRIMLIIEDCLQSLRELMIKIEDTLDKDISRLEGPVFKGVPVEILPSLLQYALEDVPEDPLPTVE